jgi:hypothetical protein
MQEHTKRDGSGEKRSERWGVRGVYSIEAFVGSM